jgi:hypothetical protein
MKKHRPPFSADAFRNDLERSKASFSQTLLNFKKTWLDKAVDLRQISLENRHADYVVAQIRYRH